MKTLRILSEAEGEIVDALDYYAIQSPQLALRFLDELDQAIRKIHSNPHHYAIYFKQSRRKNLYKFPYAIIFRIDKNEVLIQAVAHASRRPGYWASRI